MILIQGANIVDGSGKKSFVADIIVKGDRISAIGNFAGKKMSFETVIDGNRAMLTPGFIDIHNTSDHYLGIFTNPSQSDFLLQGITTILGGHCGASLAPLLYGSLEAMGKWTDINLINVNWHSVKEFFEILRQKKIGVNFAMLAGHTTIRRAILGEDLRDLTVREIEVMRGIINKALEEGVFGISTGLAYSHSQRTPYNEIKACAEITATKKGIYSTHLRDERENLVESIKETIKISEETGIETLISHLKPLKGSTEEYAKTLELIEKSEARDRIHFTSYPYDTSIVPIYTLLPRWAQNGGFGFMEKHLSNEHSRNRIMEELPEIKEGELVVAQAPGNEYLIGKSLEEFAKNQGRDMNEGLLELMRVSKLHAIIFYKNIELDWILQSLKNPQNLIATVATSLPLNFPSLKHARTKNTFPKFIELITKTKLLGIETAIERVTYTPAKKIGLKERGLIKEGWYADLVLMRENKVNTVLINGKIAVSDGKLKEMGNGKILESKP